MTTESKPSAAVADNVLALVRREDRIPPSQVKAQNQEKGHAAAFRELEGKICDLVRVGDLAMHLCDEEVLNGHKITDDGSTLTIALNLLCNGLQKLRSGYYAAWHGDAIDDEEA